jgi:hypothetical protein
MARTKYPAPGDLADIKKITKGPKDIILKVIGFKFREIRALIKPILEIAIKFPPEWDHIDQLISGQ